MNLDINREELILIMAALDEYGFELARKKEDSQANEDGMAMRQLYKKLKEEHGQYPIR